MMTRSQIPRVFVSHVNNDPSGEAIWPILRERLTASGFDVLVDREVITAGALWRGEIYSWIGLCHAAVVLISRQALSNPDKHWVARETTCLICRRYVDPSLRIIPVLLDGITLAELEATERFRDLQLGETQCVVGGDLDSIAAAVSAGLANLQIPRETLLSKLANGIRAELSQYHRYQIEAVLDDCEVDLGAWSPAGDPHRLLAMHMLAVDVEKLPGILGRLVDFNSTQRQNIRRIADLLFSNWVEIEAVRGIVEEGIKKANDGTRRVLSLNAPNERLAELYALRAFPSFRPEWKLLRLTSVFGECADMADAVRQVADEIELEIERNVKVRPTSHQVNPERRAAATRADRLRLCRMLADTSRPIFITAEIAANFDQLDDLLRRSAEQYRFATFLLRSRIDQSRNIQTGSDIIRPLVPALSSERYDNFCDLDNQLYASLESGL
jgi:hypothetical protein